VNVGPGGVKVAAPRVSGPKVQAPRVKAPKLKQPKVPTSPKGFLKSFQKLGKQGKPGKGGGGSNAGEGAVAPQPVETWHWDAVVQKEGGRGKGMLAFGLVLLFAGVGAAAGWYFLVREDETPAEAAATNSTATTVRQFVVGLQPLLVRSSRDRARISSAVTRVAGCSLAPAPATQQIRQTVAGRRAVLRQVRRVPAPNPAALRVRRMFERSLSLSATAGGDYLSWIASFDGACPRRSGAAYAAALVTNRQAQASKAAFAGAYNPLARRVRARVWNSSQF
jgi:hypothetical protein